MIPILALTIPIVAILSAHQRKMAEIIHRNNQNGPAEIDSLRQEIRELRTIIHQQTIAMDDIRSRGALGTSQPSTGEVRDRLSGT
ncbi:MAG: hypothetical protein QOJ65_2472 [Fimbriimonadaceae bacterium]|nr:hypothetical protein [Fimbriimonadaceae bacterium]